MATHCIDTHALAAATSLCEKLSPLVEKLDRTYQQARREP